MIRLSILIVFGLFGATVLPDYAPMDESCLTATCGAPDGDGGVPGDPWGNKCDLNIPCKKCYFSANKCNSCSSTKKYVLCGTPANELCADGMAVATCGFLIEHQATDGYDDCNTCHGKGKQRTSVACNKNACQEALVD